MNIINFIFNSVPYFTMSNTISSSMLTSVSPSALHCKLSKSSKFQPAQKVTFYMGAGKMCEENEVKFNRKASSKPLLSIAFVPDVPDVLDVPDVPDVSNGEVHVVDNARDAFILAFNPLTPLK
jgi:hypothetical protein